jgi:hypothetical protein
MYAKMKLINNMPHIYYFQCNFFFTIYFYVRLDSGKLNSQILHIYSADISFHCFIIQEPILYKYVLVMGVS